MVKDYYKILNISHKATNEEIKKSYRRLALQYHPDRNKDPKRSIMFLEVNEAYQVLSDKAKRDRYDVIYLLHSRYGVDFKIERPAKHPPASYKKPPTYKKSTPHSRRSTKHYRARRKRKKHNPDEFKHHAKYARVILFCCFLFSSLLLLDYILPAQILHEEIISRRNSRTDGNTTDIITTSSCTFSFQKDYLLSKFSKGRQVIIKATPIFHTVLYVASKKNKELCYKPLCSIYSVFVFLLILLYIISGVGLFTKKDFEFVLNAAFASFIICIIVCLVL